MTEYGNALQELLDRGYEILRNDTTIFGIQDRSREILEHPTEANFVQLATGMTIQGIKEQREQDAATLAAKEKKEETSE